ncbi:MAG: acetate--CoA ligase [Pseudonocardia sp. SCN 72-86]|nr:MAG: acetate--CoA ligase [Pseudonocardia sp. SCN 72-86]
MVGGHGGPIGTWTPTEAYRSRSRLSAFARGLGVADRTALDIVARQDPAAYWRAVANWLGFTWQREPTSTVDQLSSPHTTQWFPGGRFNLTDNAVHRWVREGRRDHLALVAETEDGEGNRLTYGELADQIDRAAQGLHDLGVRPGSRVGMQLPMVVEAVVLQLACAQIGAIVVPVFSGFGASAVAERLGLATVSVHVVAESVRRRGRNVPLRESVATALAEVPSVRSTVVVGGRRDHPVGALPGEVSWEELMSSTAAGCAPYELDSSHPLLIAFTSGTTGAPKGVVLGQAGFAVKAASDAAFCFDLAPGDVASWITDPGWIMFQITVLGGLLAGSAVGLYSGAVDHPGPGRLWEVSRSLGLTMLGVSPTLVRGLAAAAPQPAPDLGCLRVLASSGEPWTPDAYSWLFEHVTGSRLPIINYSGGTEVSGAILSNTTCELIHPCGFAGPLPGMGAGVADETGRDVAEGLGELVLANPSPGMPTTFWGDHERYERTYWTRWPGTWVHGDSVLVEPGPPPVWYIRGRSDDTLKVAGKRIGPAEVESIVNSVDGVVESAVVGVPHEVKGEAIAVFARLGPETDLPAARAAITEAIVSRLGRPMAPEAVHVVTDLPRTRSGKIVRRMVRAVHLGDTVPDVSALEDACALDAIRAAR